MITNAASEFTILSNAWNDLEGTLRVSLICGSVAITQIHITVFADRNGDSQVDVIYYKDFTLEPNPPRLDILSVTNGVRLSWSTNSAPEYVLESSSQLGVNIWNLVTNAPVVIGKRQVVTLFNAETPAQFFRLRK